MGSNITYLNGFLIRMVNHKYFLLLLLWSILTIMNINKAYHMDDTFHLEAAKHIRDNPLRPMSGLINWDKDPTPMYEHNQPPLFFFLIAFITGLFGTGEIPLHLLISIFTYIGLLYFYKLARHFFIRQINYLMIFLAFSPAFTVNQNLMTDVPVLAILLGAAYYLIKANQSNKIFHYGLSTLFLGFGLLIKYSFLPLLVIVLLVIVMKRDFKKMVVLILPLAMLGLWSLWNYLEYGSVHMFDRPNGIHITKLWAFPGCIGSIAIFSLSILYGKYSKKYVYPILFIILVTFILSVVLFIVNAIPEAVFSKYLNSIFLINGLFFCYVIVADFFSEFRLKELFLSAPTDRFIIFLFVAALSVFIVLFAPFIATRHILLILPFALLFLAKYLTRAPQVINRMAACITIVMGLLLGISDWVYADYYRQKANSIDLPENKVVWTAGHWGWQWYSTQNGMKQYSTNLSKVDDGDYFVYPGNIAMQPFNNNIRLEVLNKNWDEASLLSFFSVKDFASMYNSFLHKPPWTLSKSPIDTIYICKVFNIESEKLIKETIEE